MNKEEYDKPLKVAEEIVAVMEKHDCKNEESIIALSMVMKAVLEMAPSEIRDKLKAVIIKYFNQI